MRLLIFLVATAAVALGQLPDAPAPQTAAPRHAWRPWGSVNFRSNREVLRDESMWLYDFADLAAGAYDAERTHEGLATTPCLEGDPYLPPHPSRWQLYRSNLPEQASVFTFGFIATKVRMPRWLMFSALAYPLQVHIRGGNSWNWCR